MYESTDFPQAVRQRFGDSFLQSLVAIAGGSSTIQFSLFVVAGGQRIAGIVVSRNTWIAKWREQMTAAGETGSIIADAFRRADEEKSYIHEDEIDGVDRPRVIHMVDAYVGATGPMLMRVDLDSEPVRELGWGPLVTRCPDAGGILRGVAACRAGVDEGSW